MDGDVGALCGGGEGEGGKGGRTSSAKDDENANIL